MQQRVGLARAFAADTQILLMDEAFSALDPLIRREMQELLVELQQELGKTIVFITHDLNEAMFLGDRIAVMRDGRISAAWHAQRHPHGTANDYVAQFVQDVDRARVLTAGDVMEPPRAVVPASAGPRAALRTMRDMQTSACFVTSSGRKLVGVVRDKDMLRLVREGSANINDVLKPTPSIVTPEQYIAELFELSVESPAGCRRRRAGSAHWGCPARYAARLARKSADHDHGDPHHFEPDARIAPSALITATLDATTDGKAVPDEGLAMTEGSNA